MNCSQANQIPFKDILYKQGYREMYSRNKKGINYYWFLSPFREEREASFCVNELLNTYYDFGTGQHGSVIDYLCSYYHCNVYKSLQILNEFDFSSFSKQEIKSAQANEKKVTVADYAIQRVGEVKHPNLIKYLTRRKLNSNFWHYLSEIHFEMNDKLYYAVAFENDSNGYELSWEYWNRIKAKYSRFKMCLIKKDITHIKNNTTNLVVLESWSDFMALLSLYPKMEKLNDFIILNSVSTTERMVSRIIKLQYETIYSATDNDSAGAKVLDILFNKFPDKVIPLNGFYRSSKDIAEHLLRK